MFAYELGVSEVTQGTALHLVMTWVVWIYGWGFPAILGISIMASMVRVVLWSRTLEKPRNYEKGIISPESNQYHQTRQIRYARFRC